jgi:flavorubredoxin
MKEFIHHLTERSYQNRTVGMMENGSWAPTAVKVMTKMLEGSKNLTFTENNVKILSALSDASRAQITALAEELMK